MLMAHRPGYSAAAQVAMLQRMVGNQALLRFLAHWAGTPTGNRHSDQHEQETQGRTWQASGPSLNFSKMRIFPPDQAIQSNSRPAPVSRSATEVRATPAGARDSANNPEDQEVAPPIVHAVLRSSGEPLEVGARTLFESRFARDFGHVRVHRDAEAVRSVEAVGAAAYTVGQHIVFGSGRYDVASDQGQRLIAHELVHTIQQRGRASGAGPLPISGPAEPSEREADRVADHVMRIAGRTVAADEPGARPSAPADGNAAAPPVVSRKCAVGHEGGRLLSHELTHVVQQKNSHLQTFIQLDRAVGKKEPPTQDVPGKEGESASLASVDYRQSVTFRDKGKIRIISNTKIIKSAEVLHTRQTSKGREKSPYEYVLKHERHVEIETHSGDKAILIIKAETYLPFDTLKANPNISLQKAISLPGDFCKLRWSLDGKYGTERFKEALYRKYGISGIKETVQGKIVELFLALNFYQEDIVRPNNPSDPCSLKEITDKKGPAFLRFNLTNQQQYQHVVDYLDGLLADRLKSEVELRKKIEQAKKQQRTEEGKAPAKAVGGEVEKEFVLPGWLKGILVGLGILALAISIVAGIAAIIGLGASIFAGAVFVEVFVTAFKILTTVGLVISLVRSLINRFGESKLSGVGDFFKKLGVSVLDAFAIGEMIESFTDWSLVTGKPLNLSEEDRWTRRTLGLAAIFSTIFGGLRWWRARGGRATAPRAPQTGAPQGAQPPTRAFVRATVTQMRRDAERIIASDRNHILRFLLDPNTNKFKRTRGLKHSELIDDPTLVQMGHVESAKLGGREMVVLQGAWENQIQNITVEMKAGVAVLSVPLIDLGGLPVHKPTAIWWEVLGLVPPGTVGNAPTVIP
jgi:hypothetical protein